MSQSMISIQRRFPSRRSFFEAIFAFYFALSALHIWMKTHDWVPVPIYWIEYQMNELLGIPNTDFLTLYFGTSVPVALAGTTLWMGLRWSRGLRFADVLLPRLAGYLIVISPIVFRLLYDARPLSDWLIGTLFYSGSLLNIVLVNQTLQNRVGAGTAVLCFGLIDCVLWRVVGTSRIWSHYDAPPGALLGFAAIASWAMYVKVLFSRQRVSN